MSATAKRLLALGANGKPTFKYKKAAETNLALTFARLRREQKEAAKQAAADAAAQIEHAPVQLRKRA